MIVHWAVFELTLNANVSEKEREEENKYLFLKPVQDMS